MLDAHQMESAIGLCYSPLPTAPLRLFSGVTRATRAIRVHLGFRHDSLCLSHSFTRQSIARPLHVNCMLDRFSERSKNEDSDNKIVGGMAGVSLALACVLGALSLSSKMNPKFNAAYAFQGPGGGHATTAATGVGHVNGKLALESLLKTINAEAVSSKQTPPQFHGAPSKDKIDELKLYAAGLTKSKKADEAVRILKNVKKKVKGAPESEHFLDMALIELLIFQGKYKEASERLDDRIDEAISQVHEDPHKLSSEKKIEVLCDGFPFLLSKAEIFLYKAIVQAMLENKDAAKWGEAFRSTLW